MTAPIAALQLASRAYGSGSASASPSSGGGGFGALVSNFARSQLETLRGSEHAMAQGVAGKIDPQAMVEAASNAQVTVQAAVSVLGKMTAAYNEVMHMSA